MITSAQGLIAGLKMEGALLFRDFKATFSSIKSMKGFYNSKSGDIYADASFTIRGNHSRAAAR